MGKQNYVIEYSYEDREIVICLTEDQANAISTFIDLIGFDGCIELATEYEGREVHPRKWN